MAKVSATVHALLTTGEWNPQGIQWWFAQMPVVGDYIFFSQQIQRVVAVVHNHDSANSEPVIELYVASHGSLEDFRKELAFPEALAKNFSKMEDSR
jgi:hypothetical protein